MFDARTLLEQIVAGRGQQADGPQQGGLAGVLGSIVQGATGGGTQNEPAGHQADSGSARNGHTNRATANENTAPSGLDQILGTLGQVLGQATQGVSEGASRIGQATGATDALTRATGKTPDGIVSQVKDVIANNQLATGAILGGLGGLMLGTKTGRELAGDAAKLGAAALIGGLAYKAYQNYQSGKPLITGATPPQHAEAAPRGSGFEAQAMSNDDATLLIRAMIAAAAADGRIDDTEQQRILEAFRRGGLDKEAEAFLTREVQSPSTVDTLASSVRTREQAMQVYAAARIAIEPDSTAETAFLSNLANKLGIEPSLAAHIDATARGASA